MAYIVPTSTGFMAIYPEFAEVDDTVIEWALARAARQVDESWTEGDFTDARMLYAAHILTLRGFGTHAEALSMSGGAVKRERGADHEIEFFAAGSSNTGASTELESTSYGRQFALLARANIAGPIAIQPNAGLGGNHLARDVPRPMRMPWDY